MDIVEIAVIMIVESVLQAHTVQYSRTVQDVLQLSGKIQLLRDWLEYPGPLTTSTVKPFRQKLFSKFES